MSSEEIASVVDEIRRRVRSRYQKQVDGLPEFGLPSLEPVGHARDAAAGKVASIGTVNPRPPGALHSIVQGIKKTVARLLAWHVREQIEFNRAVIDYMDRTLAALDEHNRHMLQLAHLTQQAADSGRHVMEWRAGWEERWTKTEIHLLRTMAEMQGAFQHRVGVMEAGFRDQVRAQHAEYLGALERNTLDVQKRFWDELGKLQREHERHIQTELRLIRQRAQAWIELQVRPGAGATPGPAAPNPESAPAAPLAFDYLGFAERFRGTADYVKSIHSFYIPYFRGRSRVVDLGCGRGEFLELLEQNGVGARGVDSDAESVALCRHKQLEAQQADLFAYLGGLADDSLDGIFSAQVVEHLPPARVAELVALAAARLEPGGVLAIETPNPECLAIFATNFYLDPTHVRPVPAALLHFYFEENGFGSIEVHQLAPAAEVFPEIAALGKADGLEAFQKKFFGGLDYAIIGRKL